MRNGEWLQKRPLDLEAIRFQVAATGILAGVGVSLLVSLFLEFLMDNVRIPEDMPGIYLYVITGLVPLITLGMVLMTISRTLPQETPAKRNRLLQDSVTYFGIPFVSVYLVTWVLYWIFRVS